MPVKLNEVAEGKIVEFHLSGKLTKGDYQDISPRIEKLIQKYGKLRILVDLHDFHGWKAGALWEDLKFDAKHFNDIERLALVGEKRWHDWMSSFCRPFTTAKIRYFDRKDSEVARQWIQEGMVGVDALASSVSR